MAEIQLTTPTGLVRTILLEQSPQTLGREASCELAFPEDSGLSRQHLTFEPSGAGWAVRDLNSKNGTFHNGERLSVAKPLAAGDTIRASRIHMVYQDGKRPDVVFDQTGADQVSSHHTVVVSLKDILSPDTSTGS